MLQCLQGIFKLRGSATNFKEKERGSEGIDGGVRGDFFGIQRIGRRTWHEGSSFFIEILYVGLSFVDAEFLGIV